MGSSWARRTWVGIFGVVISAGAAANAPLPPEVSLRPVSHDARDPRPFAIVDKRTATLSIHAANGRLLGRTSALLGLTPGDVEPASSRGKAPDALKRAERVTPAGRFEAMPGRNLSGERVVWFDYDASLAIHRLRPAPVHERRAERLASADPDQARITLGCVVVDPDFFDRVVLPALGSGPSLVYVLPERAPAIVAGAVPGRAAAP